MVRLFLAGCAAAAVLAAAPASATEFVKNGNFSQMTGTDSRQMSTDTTVTKAQLLANSGSNQYVTSWTNLPTSCGSAGDCSVDSHGRFSGDGSTTAGYNFIVRGSDATKVDGIDTNSQGSLYLWGKTSDDRRAPSNGFTTSNNGTGGNFLAADGAYQQSVIAQTISGLTIGQKYVLSFDYAGAQQHGYDGATTEGWTAIFAETDFSDAQSYSTPILNNVSHGFTGWNTVSTVFTATSTTEILGFLANGTPDGKPPFSLLDNVSLQNYTAPSVPEPATWAMMLAGFGFIGTAMRRKRFNELWKA